MLRMKSSWPSAEEKEQRISLIMQFIARGLTRTDAAREIGVSSPALGKQIDRYGLRSVWEARINHVYGVSYEDLRGYEVKTLHAFNRHRTNARHRGIEFNFTLPDWLMVWNASGHWAERGRGAGYVMCRKGDIGPYSVENVFIAPATVNASVKRNPAHALLPTGVTPCGNGYRANRQINGVGCHLGVFATPDLAYAAYLKAESSFAASSYRENTAAGANSPPHPHAPAVAEFTGRSA